MDRFARVWVWCVLLVCFGGVFAGCGGGSGSGLAITTSSLPSADLGAGYGASLSASGGTSPYIWSLSSGTLPAGLSLNGGGAINGLPTKAGMSTFTLEVTDSSTTPLTTTKSLTLLVGNLAITTASLPAGSTNVAYSATLQASGGTTPYTWSVSSGALPNGLTLNASTGAISGTPTNGGVSSFTVQLTDSESPTVSATATFTITLSPLVLTSRSLPNGLEGTPYNLPLNASGGATPYTWSVLTGSLSGGLNLDATTGAISGTPTGSGTYSFTVHVADAETPPEVATETYFLEIESSSASTCAAMPAGNESFLNGHYALVMQGYQGGGAGTAVAEAASFAADGAGHVTGGDIDVSGAQGATHYTIAPFASGSPFSTYTVGADPSGSGNVGCAMLATSAGTTLTIHFSLGGVNAAVASRGKVIEFDNSSGAGTVASGVMALQDTSAFSASHLSVNYAFGLTGTTLGGSAIAEAGSLSASSSGGLSNVFADVDTVGTNSSALSGGSGSITGISPTDGRATAAISLTSATSALAVYIVNANEAYLVSTSAAASGRMLATNRSFTAGNYIFYATGMGSCGVTACSDVSLALLNLSGGTANGTTWDYNVDASESQAAISAGGYAVAASSGRVTFTGTGSNGFVAYLVSPAVDGINAIVAGTDAAAHGGFATLQSGTSMPAEHVIYGTIGVRSGGVISYAGTAGIAAGGAFSGTQDSSGETGSLDAGVSVARTVTLIANGTGSAGTTGGNNIAVTDGSRLFWFDYGNGAPAVITVAEAQ